MEGGLDAPGARKTVGSEVKTKNIRKYGTPATPRIYRLRMVGKG